MKNKKEIYSLSSVARPTSIPNLGSSPAHQPNPNTKPEKYPLRRISLSLHHSDPAGKVSLFSTSDPAISAPAPAILHGLKGRTSFVCMKYDATRVDRTIAARKASRMRVDMALCVRRVRFGSTIVPGKVVRLSLDGIRALPFIDWAIRVR